MIPFETHIVRLFPYALIPLMSGFFIFLITVSAFLRSYRSYFARLTFLFCSCLAVWSASSAFLITTPILEGAQIAGIVYIISWLSLPVLFMFAVLVQTKRSYLLLIPVILLFTFFAYWLIVLDHSKLILYYFGYYPVFELPSGIVIMVFYYLTVTTGLLMLWDQYREAQTSTSRNQARLLWLGTTIGFLLATPESLLLISSNRISSETELTLEKILTVFISTIAVYIGYSIAMLLLRIVPMKGLGRNRRLAIIIGFFITPLIIPGLFVFSAFSYSIYPISGIGMMFGTIIIMYASMKYRLMDITEIFRKYLLYYFLVAFWMIVYIVFISMFIETADMALIIFAGVFLVLSFNPLYQVLQQLTDRVLFKERYDYQKIIRNMSSKLVTVLDFEKLLELIRDSITRVLQVSNFTLLLYQHDDDHFKSVIRNGARSGRELLFTAADSGIKIVRLANRPIYLEELTEGADNYDVDEYTSLFAETESVLLIPMVYKGMLRGVMCLGDKESGEIYTSRDVELLEILANQAIIAIDNARLYELAITDELTNLYIIRFFNQRIIDEITSAVRMKRHLSLLMIDIDHFKKVNDTFGHQIGDIILKEVAAILEVEVRAIDLVARYGGEEFAIILPETDNGLAVKIGERIRKTIEDHSFSKGTKQTVSIGAASIDGSRPSAAVELSQGLTPAERKKFFSELKEGFIYHADRALYRAKDEGRNRIENNGVLQI